MARVRGIVRNSPDAETDDEVLPWLDAADDAYDEPTGIDRKWVFLGAAAFALALIGTVWFFYSRGGSGSGDGAQLASGDIPVIEAPEGSFKRRPEGDEVEDVPVGDSALTEIAQGDTPSDVPPLSPPRAQEPGMLDPSGVFGTGQQSTDIAEAPIPPGGSMVPPRDMRPAPDLDPAPMPAPAPAPIRQATPGPRPTPPSAPPEPAAPASAMASGGYYLQLGAFSSTARANAAWSEFTGKHSALSGLSADVQPLNRSGSTLYRLRAAGVPSRARAEQLCASLKAAGQPCIVSDR